MLTVISGCARDNPGTAATGSANASPAAPQAARAPTRTLAAVSRTIRIPVTQWKGSASTDADPSSLAVLPEALEQESEGPRTFEVLSNGSFAIADPLRNRLAIYAPDGQFQRAIDVGFPISTIVKDGENLRVRAATQNIERVISPDGKVLATAQAAGDPAPGFDAVVNADGSGMIRRRAQPGAAADAGFRVLLDPSVRMATLRVVDDNAGGMYVKTESVDQADRSLRSLDILLRRYRGDGQLDLEIRNIPTDYYVTPTKPFAVGNNRVYHLYPRLEAVFIHVWDVD